MTRAPRLIFGIALALAAATALLVPASAAGLVCRDGYQVVQGSLLATPYCQDALVGQVARERGFKVSDHEIRHNPNLKRHICQFIGRDIRVTTACIDANGYGRGPRG